jgi:hypothetical protein
MVGTLVLDNGNTRAQIGWGWSQMSRAWYELMRVLSPKMAAVIIWLVSESNMPWQAGGAPCTHTKGPLREWWYDTLGGLAHDRHVGEPECEHDSTVAINVSLKATYWSPAGPHTVWKQRKCCAPG